MKYIALMLLFAGAAIGVQAQQPLRISWETLTHVNWEKKYNEKYKQQFQYPKFGTQVKEFEGKEVIIKGYLLPADVTGDYMVLSRFPYESCFFCGGAGPESVMEIYMKTPKRLNKKQVTFKGKLRLNDKDVDFLIYMLDEAEVMDDSKASQ